MQLLMSKSYEFGEHNGLDIIKGQVLPLKNNNDQVKIPQVGWNKITKYNSHGLDWNNSPLKKLPDNSYMYFVHSFYVAPIEKDIILSTTKYGEINFCSSLKSKGIVLSTSLPVPGSKNTGIGITASSFVPAINFDTLRSKTPCWNTCTPSGVFIAVVSFKSMFNCDPCGPFGFCISGILLIFKLF